MTTYVFPGQGAQALGMGKDLFPEFPEYVEQANNILGYDIRKLCLEDSQSQLNQTNFTQPALFVVNALFYLKKESEAHPVPQFVAGHSLGEYSALFAAKVFNFETGLKLVQKRGSLMANAKGGGMAAIIGITADQVNAILTENGLSNICIGNYNSFTQVVISGPAIDIKNAEHFFVDQGAMVMPLKVSGAFHSKYMDDAKNEFEKFITQFKFVSPQIPVIANYTAEAYPAAESMIKEYLANQINHPVYWTQTIRFLLDQGEDVFEEVGPGRILTGLINRIRKDK